MYELTIGNKNYSSWSLRPWALLRECGIPFEEQQVLLHPDSSWEIFRVFAPNGKVPCLHDGDTVVWDSLGIVEYLAERHADVWPSNSDARTWARCASAEMHAGFTALRQTCPMNCAIRVQLHAISPGLQRDLDRLDELWNEGLTRFGGPFLAGAGFTAVDAFYSPVAFRIQSYRLPLSESALGYAARLLALPSIQRWYVDALAETARVAASEEHARRVGEVLEDLRQVVP